MVAGQRISAADYRALAGAKPKARKYGNRPVIVDGLRFDSKAEAGRWVYLRHLQQAGEITDLRRQVRIPLHALSGAVVGHYIADFEYLRQGLPVTEDVKSAVTVDLEIFQWKRRHFAAEYGREIVTVGVKRRARPGARRKAA